MYCILWIIFQILVVVVQADVSSGSAEALAKAAAKNNGGAVGAAAAGNGVNAQNGAPLIGETIARLLQLGGSLFIQPVGNPGGQAPLQQLIPLTALQQGGANGNLQGQMAGQPGGGPVMVFGVLPQNNAGIDPRQMQMIPVALPGNQQLPGGAAAAGQPLGRLRFQRSVATRLRRTQSPLMKTAATEEEKDDEEESSGMDPEEKHLNLDHTTPRSVP